jgi:hypothetical protein
VEQVVLELQIRDSQVVTEMAIHPLEHLQVAEVVLAQLVGMVLFLTLRGMVVWVLLLALQARLFFVVVVVVAQITSTLALVGMAVVVMQQSVELQVVV